MNAPAPPDSALGCDPAQSPPTQSGARNADVCVSLRRLVRDLLVRRGFEHGIHFGEEPLWLDAHAASLVIRIVDEALRNSGQHGEPTRVDILIRRTGSQCELKVRDQGKGFDVENAGRGTGLTGMRAWAATLGGSFDIKSSPGRGTVVQVRFPLV